MIATNPMDPRIAERDPNPAGSPRAGPGLARRRASVVVVRDRQTLTCLVPAWEDLAAAALEPNVFYEHWMLLPALDAFGAAKDICVVAVLIHDCNPQGRGARPTLGALFPLERIRNFRRLGVSALGLWQHVHCYDCTPLIRADAAEASMTALFRWLQSGEADASVLELGWISGDGPFHKTLVDVTTGLGLVSWSSDGFTRGRWVKNDPAGRGLESAPSGELRRRLRRLERRLSERGRVEHLALRPGDDIGRWIDSFLRVEASGWKGARGTALADTRAACGYFREVATSASRRGRLLMLGIDFDGRPVARRCAFAAGDGSFAFKTAYSEEFSGYSPGAMLEIDSLRQLDALPGLRWMDSCAAPDNLLINRLSNDRKRVRSLVIGAGALGELVVSGLPLLRWTTRRLFSRTSMKPKEATTCLA
jgi:CelD/BcsL family acetyltransferase involved in cellulose biosynthesis